MNPIRVTVWNEFVHEQTNPAVAQAYPQGIHGGAQLHDASGALQ